jgi:hypothetical protein
VCRALDLGQRGTSVRRRRDLVALRDERPLEHAANRRIVVHDENPDP